MTGWDILNQLINSSPSVVMILILGAVLAAVVVFIVGFGNHGINFLKYGFKQMALDTSIEDRLDKFAAKLNTSIDERFAKMEAKLNTSIDERFVKMEAKFDERFAKIDERFAQIDDRFAQIDDRFDKMDTKIMAIETNHFGHLKNYLGILNGVLLDKQIIDNQTKARMDNELRGM